MIYFLLCLYVTVKICLHLFTLVIVIIRRTKAHFATVRFNLMDLSSVLILDSID
jgi:hypothetical protein